MKLSVFTVSMPEYNIVESAKKLAELGYDAVEWRIGNPPPKEKPDNYSFEGRYWSYNQSTLAIDDIESIATEVAQVCKKEGVDICSLTTYLGVYDLDKIESVMKAANSMGCGMMRVNVPSYNEKTNYRELLDKTVTQASKVEELAKKYNIKVAFEIHMGNMIPSASAAYRFISNFDPKYMGIIHDAGNMVHEGFENYRMGVEILGEYLAHVHIKNAIWKHEGVSSNGADLWKPCWVPVKKGFANLERLISVLKDTGYEGYLSIEDFSNEEGTDDKLKSNIEYIRGLLY